MLSELMQARTYHIGGNNTMKYSGLQGLVHSMASFSMYFNIKTLLAYMTLFMRREPV